MKKVMYKMVILSDTKPEKPSDQGVDSFYFFLSSLCEQTMRQGFYFILFYISVSFGFGG